MLEPRLRRMIEGALGAQGFFRFLDTEVTALDHGTCTLALAKRPQLLQQNGYIHGGVVAYLVDNASAAAAATCLRPGQTVLTAEYKVNFISPATGDTLLCRAEVVKAGRRMSVVEARVFSRAKDGSEDLAAIALTTMAVVADGDTRASVEEE